MAGYKEPGFQDRVAAASAARAKALAQLKAKPAVDPAVLAERAEKAREREELRAKRAAERAEAKRIAEAAKAAAIVVPPTEAELKAARDARYAARKARKSSR
ncbi:hypothetical protein EDF56_102105 [Novosphingobium sp. PhB165]|uniref:DUF6481 family protein n=1 Tax=Novosphingobium sp. PhB165 TaxID=2485105 RepID=UPI001042BD30|nr:DUF6481 family protein [Novosphingobium sp. PhB165]TCM20444.1 hypothetical protein EDF56_102105 [Novosphingobium sp. PhB165]